MPFARLAVILSLLTLGGCGLVNQRRSVSWTASLTRAPDIACVLKTIAAVPGVARVQMEDGTRTQIILVGLSGPSAAASGVDIYVVFEHGQPERFRMDYPGWPPAKDIRAIAAPRIVARLSQACAMPELAGARENRQAEWSPYLFNI